MALFRRKKTEQAAMPPEVQDYYQAEGRERTGVAWLLAIATLFVTVLVVLGVFFGGRWAYRKISHTDKPAPTNVQTNTSNDKSSTTPSTPAPQTSTPAAQGNSSPPSSTAPPSATSSTPAAAPQTSNAPLPNTGPGDMLAVFVITSIAGTLLHDRLMRVRIRN